jgi:hypothetical protein
LGLFATLSKNDTQHNVLSAVTMSVVMPSVVFLYGYAECRYAECRGALSIIISEKTGCEEYNDFITDNILEIT